MRVNVIIFLSRAVGYAMTEILGGLPANGKLIIIGASDEPVEVPPDLMKLGSLVIISITLQALSTI